MIQYPPTQMPQQPQAANPYMTPSSGGPYQNPLPKPMGPTPMPAPPYMAGGAGQPQPQGQPRQNALLMALQRRFGGR